VGASAIFHRGRSTLAAHPNLTALVLVVLVASLVRVCFMFRAPVFLLNDSGTYYLPAHDLVHGLGFDISIRRPPVYPGFLAGTILLFGEDLRTVAFVQHMLGVLTAGLVYMLGTITFGRIAGVLAALLTALDGTLLVSEHYVMPESLLLALLLATFLIAILAIRGERRALFLLSGVLLGLSALCKPVAQALIPVIPFVVAASYGSVRRAVLPTLLLLAGFAAIGVPWMVRNWAVHGSLTTAGALGQTLVARTAKHDTGFRYYDERNVDQYGDARETTARQIVQNGIRQRQSDGVIYRRVQDRLELTDAEANQFMRNLAIEVIAARPVYYVQGTLQMTWQLLVGEVERLRTDWKTQGARFSREEWEERAQHLLGNPTQVHQNEFDRAEAIVALYQPGILGPTLPTLALVGLLIAARVPSLRPALLPGLAALTLVVTSAALDGPVARYRYPADPLLALTAMGGLVWAIAAIASRIGRFRSPESIRVPRVDRAAEGV
jgi:4-amino-4-deoxy-L-arabinose transferase-like glycosyltransferase